MGTVTVEFTDGTKITGEVEDVLRLMKRMSEMLPKIGGSLTSTPSELKKESSGA